MARRSVLAFVALGFALAASLVLASEDKVVVLKDDTLHDYVNSNDFVLVEFYAPWCGHCKSIAPELQKSADDIADYTPKVTIAKVDATEEKKLATEFGIQGFPTLKWFVKGKPSDYGGGRTADAITSWLKKKTGPACKDLTSVADLDAFKDSAEVVVVGAFTDADASKAYESVAQGDDTLQYGRVLGASADVLKALGIAGDGVVLFKKFDEGRNEFKGDLSDQDAITKFVSGNRLPIIVPFSQSTAPQIFGGAVKQHLLLFIDAADEKTTADFKAMAKPVAEELRGEYIVVSIDKSDARLLEFFGIQASSIPTARVVQLGDAGLKKFKPVSEPVTADVLRETVKGHKAGDLKQDLKSEEEPAKNDEPVKVIVGKTFKRDVKDSGKDVLLEFYAPWCGHCKQLEPKWKSLSEKYKDTPNLVIAKMDATANEIEEVSVQGFPTIKLFKATGEVVDFEGGREVDDFVAFLEKNADSCKA